MDNLPENADPLEHLALACAERDEAEKFMLIAMERAKCAEAEVERLRKALNIIFPAPVKLQDRSEVDSSADENLEAAIIDFEGGNADNVTLETLRRILKQLIDARNTMTETPLKSQD